jgi:hypothetical protein
MLRKKKGRKRPPRRQLAYRGGLVDPDSLPVGERAPSPGYAPAGLLTYSLTASPGTSLDFGVITTLRSSPSPMV